MIKLVKKTFIFIVISIVISSLVEVALVSLFGRGINIKIDGHSNTYSRLQDANKTSKGYRFLALGSSHAYRSFVSKDNHLFNLGSTAQGHLQTYSLVQEYFDNINPEIVIYEVYPDVFLGNFGLESQIDINHSLTDFKSIRYIPYYLSIKNFRSIVNSIFLDFFKLKHKAGVMSRSSDTKNIYTDGGYVRRDGFLKKGYCKHEQPVFLSDVDAEQLHYFIETITLIKEKQVPVYLVIAPYTYSPLNMNEYLDFIERNTGLSVLDYSNYFCVDPTTYFFDSGHLNFNGASIFTAEVLDSINTLERIRLIEK